MSLKIAAAGLVSRTEVKQYQKIEHDQNMGNQRKFLTNQSA